MLRIFKSFSPQTIILLIILALGLHLHGLLQPATLGDQSDVWGLGLLYPPLSKLSANMPHLFAFLGITNIFLQSLVVNRLAVEYRLFPQSTFLPAALFLMLTALFPPWSGLHQYSLANWFLLFIINNLLRLPSTGMPHKLIFNCGMFVACGALLYLPFVIYAIFVIWAIALIRAFKVADYLIVLIGLATPPYFIAGYLFLFDKKIYLPYIENKSLSILHNLHFSTVSIVAISTITILGIFSAIYLNRYMVKMLSAQKKMWYIIIIVLIISNLLALLHFGQDNRFYLLALAPTSILLASIWQLGRSKVINNLLFYSLLAIVIYTNWFLP